MARKCAPGVICIENVTLVFLLLCLLVVSFLYYQNMRSRDKVQTTSTSVDKILVQPQMATTQQPDVFNDPYAPPLKNTYAQSLVPVNIPTQGPPQSYSQIGILTNNDGQNMILPLMGRRYTNRGDKWMYYTISNTGNLNTKLQVIVNGRRGTYEYGVNELNNGDEVLVDGYNRKFRATIYDNSQFNYIPY
tara:strand:- start:6045 stop:6614 length:570 start_codon:yes stop_codon:yes gene_type:complete